MFVSKTVKETVEMWTNVMKICDDNPMTVDQVKMAVKAIKDAHMFEAVEESYNVYLSGVNSKKKVVWIKGRTNSGKTFFANELSKIFISETFADLDSKYVGTRV